MKVQIVLTMTSTLQNSVGFFEDSFRLNTLFFPESHLCPDNWSPRLLPTSLAVLPQPCFLNYLHLLNFQILKLLRP